MKQNRNIFVYGLTGSGKDTVSNYLIEYNYLKIRIADTIKRIICETQGLSFDELEEQKRIKPELRMMHHEVSALLDKLAGFAESSTNRVKQLIDGTAFDYQWLSEKHLLDTPRVICDCRTFKEASLFLNAGWTGIFLARTTEEFKHASHFTEKNMFHNGELIELCKNFEEQIYIIWNGEKTEVSEYPEELVKHDIFFETDGTVKKLHNVIDLIITCLYQ